MPKDFLMNLMELDALCRVEASRLGMPLRAYIRAIIAEHHGRPGPLVPRAEAETLGGDDD